jgi:hypothetical protein
MRPRTATWLAWSMVVLSVALLVGRISLSRMVNSTVPELPSDGGPDPVGTVVTLATVLTFSVVGAIVASRHPRNTIGWLFCSTGLVVGLNEFAGGYAEVWLASGFGIDSIAEAAVWFSSWLWIPLVLVPRASCFCCSRTVGCPRTAGGPWPGPRSLGSPDSSQATRWGPVRSKTTHKS